MVEVSIDDVHILYKFFVCCHLSPFNTFSGGGVKNMLVLQES